VNSPALIGIFGPTASGKTCLAEALADRLDAHLINADAFQAYAGMDIGTGKTLQPERYALISFLKPSEPYGVGDFVLRARQHIAEWAQTNRSVIVVGGTGLYLRALFENYSGMVAAPSPEIRASLNEEWKSGGLAPLVERLKSRAPQVALETDLKNPVRVIRALERLEGEPLRLPQIPEMRQFKFGLVPDEAGHGKAIEDRVDQMVQNGWVEEVQRLKQTGFGPSDPGFRAIGYRQIYQFLVREAASESMVEQIKLETRQYAKRQLTWMRTEPRLTVLNVAESGSNDLVASVLNGLM
jgi:tRNA dimethylallyltransferase